MFLKSFYSYYIFITFIYLCACSSVSAMTCMWGLGPWFRLSSYESKGVKPLGLLLTKHLTSLCSKCYAKKANSYVFPMCSTAKEVNKWLLK